MDVLRSGVSVIIRSVLFVLLCTFQVYAQSQSAVADSIERELNALNPEAPDYLTEKAGSMGTLLQVVKYSDPQKALRLCDELGQIYLQIGDTVHAYEAMYRYKAGIYELGGKYDLMLTHLEAYASALNSIGKSDGYVYVDIGNVYFGFGMTDLAKENYRFAEYIFTRNGNIQGLCTIYNNYAQIHMSMKENDSALIWLRKSYSLRLNTLKDPVLAHESMYLMAKIFRDNHQYDSAIAYLQVVVADIRSKAVDAHTDHIALHQEFAGAYTAMGITYTYQQKWDSAEVYFSAGEKLYKAYSYRNRLPQLYTAWARMFIARKDAGKAWLYVQKAEESSNWQNPNDAMSLYNLMADYYELTGDMERSYRNRMMFYRIEDSLQATGNAEQLIVVGSRVMQLQNQARIERQKVELAQKDLEAKQNAQERTIFLIVMIASLISIIIGAISLHYLNKKNRIIQKYNTDLQIANATKEQLLSVISHDLRSPFNTLIGISDLMVRNMKNKDYAGVTGNAELIRDSSRKAYVLLDNLMQWVSLQKESIQVKRELVVLTELVDEVLLLFRAQALANSSSVLKEVRVLQAMTDRNMLQVILRNLVSNALKNIPVGGTVRIILDSRGTDLCVIVEDNGRGLNEADLATLFMAKDKTSIARKGGGLGLVLVDQFVRQLDGTISAENIAGGGARFTMILRNAVQPQITASTAAQNEVRPPMTIKDWQIISPVLEQLRRYEIYDTSEIRKTVSQIPEGDSPGVEWWRAKILESVYRSDENGFRNLIQATSYEDFRK